MKRLLSLIILLWPASAFPVTFAQLALGGGYEAVLFVTNKSSLDWSGSLSFYKRAADGWTGIRVNGQRLSGYSGNFLMGPGETWKLTMRADGSTQSGYMELLPTGTSNEYDIAVAYFYNFYDSAGQLLDSVGSRPSTRAYKFVFPAEYVAGGIDTGMAWAPAVTTAPFEIHLTLVDDAGKQVARRTSVFLGHAALFISELFPTMPRNFCGHVLVESADMICLEVLRMNQTAGGFQLTSTPPDADVP
jgi:hypothetical protein